MLFKKQSRRKCWTDSMGQPQRDSPSQLKKKQMKIPILPLRQGFRWCFYIKLIMKKKSATSVGGAIPSEPKHHHDQTSGTVASGPLPLPSVGAGLPPQPDDRHIGQQFMDPCKACFNIWKCCKTTVWGDTCKEIITASKEFFLEFLYLYLHVHGFLLSHFNKKPVTLVSASIATFVEKMQHRSAKSGLVGLGLIMMIDKDW